MSIRIIIFIFTIIIIVVYAIVKNKRQKNNQVNTTPKIKHKITVVDYQTIEIKPPRHLNDEEKDLLQQLTSHKELYILNNQIKHLRVIGKCSCGCKSVDFWVADKKSISPYRGDLRLLPSEIELRDTDGVPIWILLLLEDGYISNLDISKADSQPVHRDLNPKNWSQKLRGEWGRSEQGHLLKTEMENLICEIHVYLLNEGVDTWRPVKAEKLGENKFRIIGTNDYDLGDEKWEFLPGDIVRCEQKMLADGVAKVTRLVAVEKLTATPKNGK